MRRTNDKDRNKRLISKSVILVFLFLGINILWLVFFHHDPIISVNLGIICPIIYGIFYFLVKQTRRKLRSKIKAFIYIPIMYTLFGIMWLFFSLGVAKITHKSDTIQTSETVIEKLEFKYFFLFNYNLSYLSRIPMMIENKNWKTQSFKSQTIMKSKYQTNNMIVFISLFLIQSLCIYSTENIIYPYFRPEQKRKRKSRRKSPPRDTFISEEQDIFLNFGEKEKQENNSTKYPTL